MLCNLPTRDAFVVLNQSDRTTTTVKFSVRAIAQ